MAQYPVITSNRASKDFQNIRAQHDELVRALSTQSDKVAGYRQQQASDLASQNAMNMEMEKSKMVANSEAQKNAITFAMKQADTDVKMASLMNK